MRPQLAGDLEASPAQAEAKQQAAGAQDQRERRAGRVFSLKDVSVKHQPFRG